MFILQLQACTVHIKFDPILIQSFHRLENSARKKATDIVDGGTTSAAFGWTLEQVTRPIDNPIIAFSWRVICSTQTIAWAWKACFPNTAAPINAN